MHPAFGEIREELVDTRWRNGGTADIRDAVRGAEYLQLGKHIFLPSSFWERLTNEERRLAIAMAAALSSRTAVLVGRSAALALGLPLRLHGSVEMGLPSGSVPRKSSWPAGVQFYNEQLLLEDVTEHAGVRITSEVIALAGVIKRGSFADALITADAVRARGIRDDVALPRFERLTGPWTKKIGPVWSAAVPWQDGPMEMSEARAMLIQRGVPVIVGAEDRALTRVPLIVNERASFRIVEGGPRDLHEVLPSGYWGYRDFVIGVEGFNRNPRLVIERLLARTGRGRRAG